MKGFVDIMNRFNEEEGYEGYDDEDVIMKTIDGRRFIVYEPADIAGRNLGCIVGTIVEFKGIFTPMVVINEVRSSMKDLKLIRV